MIDHPPLHVEHSDALVERLATFAALLRRWNGAINLISRHDEAWLEQRHINDSLQLIPLIPADATHAIDLGSGAGFPGLVLAIATGIPFTLVESDHRKAAFLLEAARATQTEVDVIPIRMEALDNIGAPLVTARAVAPVATLLPILARLVAPSGVALLPKGQNAETELRDAARNWDMCVERHESLTHPLAAILKISHISRRRQ